MNCEILFAEWSCPWRFRDSHRLSRWLAARPWDHAGGLAALQLSGLRALEAVEQPLREAIAAAGAAFGPPRVAFISGSSGQPTVRAILGGYFGIPEQSRPLEFRQAMANLLSQERTIMLLDLVRGQAHGSDLAREAAETVESVSKLSPDAPLTILLLENAGLKGGALINFDLSSGGPLISHFEETPADPRTRWQVYCQRRIAWESGGNLEIYLGWGASGSVGQVLRRVGDDEALERALNDWSAAQMKTLSEAERERLRTVGDLEAIPPWFARATLPGCGSGPTRMALRSRLVCQPLAAELVARCLALESGWRAKIGPRLMQISQFPSEESARQAEEFRLGNNNFPAYPAAHPARPVEPFDVWAFCSLGELAGCVGRGRRGPNFDVHTLRAVRNSLAHGHFVGWKECEAVYRLSLDIAQV